MSHAITECVNHAKEDISSAQIFSYTQISLFIEAPFRGVHTKRFQKICSKFTGEHPCRGVITMKLQSNFIEFTLRHGCSLVNLLHIFRTPFRRNTPLNGCFRIYE